MEVAEPLWTLSMVMLSIGSGMFRALPRDREAAARGLAAGVLLVILVVAVAAWHVHFGNFG